MSVLEVGVGVFDCKFYNLSHIHALDARSLSAGASSCATCVAGTYSNLTGTGREAVMDFFCVAIYKRT